MTSRTYTPRGAALTAVLFLVAGLVLGLAAWAAIPLPEAVCQATD